MNPRAEVSCRHCESESGVTSRRLDECECGWGQTTPIEPRPPEGCEHREKFQHDGDAFCYSCNSFLKTTLPPSEKCECGARWHAQTAQCKPSPEFPAEVEAKIKRICVLTQCTGFCCNGPVNWSRDTELRELLRLAQKSSGEGV